MWRKRQVCYQCGMIRRKISQHLVNYKLLLNILKLVAEDTESDYTSSVSREIITFYQLAGFSSVFLKVSFQCLHLAVKQLPIPRIYEDLVVSGVVGGGSVFFKDVYPGLSVIAQRIPGLSALVTN
ncbi:hypothetical protein STEG23_037236 [Scotinomys teguina]